MTPLRDTPETKTAILNPSGVVPTFVARLVLDRSGRGAGGFVCGNPEAAPNRHEPEPIGGRPARLCGGGATRGRDIRDDARHAENLHQVQQDIYGQMEDNSSGRAGQTARTEPDRTDRTDTGEARKPGQPGHTPIGVSGMSGRDGCPGVRVPATKAERRAAWAEWINAGEPWPPPAGLVSAALDACMRRDRRHDRFRR